MLKIAVLIFLIHCVFSQDNSGIWDYGGVTTSQDPSDYLWPVDPSTPGNGSNEATNTRLPEKVPKEECECIPYYLCDSRYTISKRPKKENYGEDIINIRVASKKECPHYILKCCDEEDTKELEEDIAAEETMSTTSTTTTTPPPPPTPKACGFRSSSNNPHDGVAEFGEFPWVVAIYFHNATNAINYVCTGTLIHPEVVVTAAHCLRQLKKPPRVRAGEWGPYNQKYPHQDREVSGVTIHAKFTPMSLQNDIALLFLKTPVELGVHINVVCLPPPNTVVDNKRCISNGWTKDRVLKKVELPVVPKKQCEQDLRRTKKLPRDFMLHPSFICAGGEAGKDTCEGDGGSPLVCPFKEVDRYFQAGIVSWGIGCGGHRVPGVYVNIASFREWIDEKLRRKKLDISVYHA